MPDLKLTAQQLTFFHAFGFLAFPGLLKDRIDEIIREFEAIFAARGGGHAGKPHEGKQRSCIVPFIDQNAVLSSLLDDPRIHGIAASLLGDDFNYMPSDGNYYAGDTGWHSDGWHAETLHLKIAFYLDPLTRDTGCLRVIPGSHKIGDRFAGGWFQNAVGGKHQIAGFGLGLIGQRQMDSHLVAIEVGIECGADERRDLDRKAFDEHWLECLNR